MDKVVEINEKNIEEFYKKIRKLKIYKYFNKQNEIVLKYKNKIYNNKSKNIPKELEIVMNLTNILNTTKRKERISLVYDYSCDYLDNEFLTKKLCGFHNNMCIRNRNRKDKTKQVTSCCERTKTRVVCDKFDDKNKVCTIKSLGCKLFVCPYLKKQGIKYTPNRVPYLKYFYSWRQKAIADSCIFLDKDEIMDKLIKFYKLP